MKLRKYVKTEKVISLVITFLIVVSSIIVTKVNTVHYKDKQAIQIVVSEEGRYMTMKGRPMVVSATAYYGDKSTYTGAVPQVGVTLAVDPSVIPFGTKVYIPEFNKVFIAQDTGSAIKGNKIDIFMNSYDECMTWGRRDITIYVLE